MKILRVNTYDKGGAARTAIKLHQSLLSKNIDDELLFLFSSKQNIPRTHIFPSTINSSVNLLNRFLKNFYFYTGRSYRNDLFQRKHTIGYESFSLPKTDFELETCILYKQADIIHLHWVAEFIDNRFFKKNTKPIVWTLSDMNPFTGGCHYSNNCLQYKEGCQKCPQVKGHKAQEKIRKSFNYKLRNLKNRHLLHIVAPSKWLFEASMQSLLFENCKHYYIETSVNTSVFKPLDKRQVRLLLDFPQDKKIITMIGTYTNERKGAGVKRQFIEKINSLNMHLCIVGEKIDNQQNITSFGKIEQDIFMNLIYNASDVIVITSKEDNLPNVMLESFACGVPVIAFKQGGMKDAIIENINGLLVENFTYESFLKTIEYFFQNSERYDKKNIRSYALKHYDMSEKAEAYIRLYQQIIKNI